jgi:regulator of replication initiation timing
VTNPADNPDPRVQAKHFRGAYLAVKAENDRLTIEVANLRRKLQLQTANSAAPERIWSDALDGRK